MEIRYFDAERQITCRTFHKLGSSKTLTAKIVYSGKEHTMPTFSSRGGETSDEADLLILIPLIEEGAHAVLFQIE